jgi:SAM-dependent methyltransferase
MVQLTTQFNLTSNKAGNMKFKERFCPNCHSTDTLTVFAESNYDSKQLNSFSFASRKIPELMHYRLIVCPVCNLLYASPAPKAEYLKDAYENAHYDSQLEAQFASKTYSRYLSKYLKHLPNLKNTLDIGTGDGAFLERLLELGFSHISGIEPSKAPIQSAKPHVRSLIRQGVFEAKYYRPNSLSLISCFQTLEHLDEPKQICSTVFDLLKPGGAFFTVCHNHRSLSAKILKTRSPIFDIEHLQLFSPKSIRFLLENLGFTKTVVFPIFNCYPLKYWLRLLPFNIKMKNYLTNLFDTIKIGSIPILIPAGNMGAIGFKPL